MPILLPQRVNRTKIMEKMKQSGIQTSIHYPPIHLFTYYHKQYPSSSLEKTEQLANRELSLPLYPGMGLEDISIVVATLRDALL